jgi:hypothetical protein
MGPTAAFAREPSTTRTTPGAFSKNLEFRSPDAAGPYTLCGFLLNYPSGRVLKRRATAHFTAQ